MNKNKTPLECSPNRFYRKFYLKCIICSRSINTVMETGKWAPILKCAAAVLVNAAHSE